MRILVFFLLLITVPLAAHAEEFRLDAIFDEQQTYTWSYSGSTYRETIIGEVKVANVLSGGSWNYHFMYRTPEMAPSYAVKECDSGGLNCVTKTGSPSNPPSFSQKGGKVYQIGRLFPDPEPEPEPDPDPEPTPDPTPNPGPDPGGNVPGALTLPKVNIFKDPAILQTLWNYLGSVFYLGMPVLLIVLAIIIVGYVLHLVIDAIKAAKEKEKDDDDDW